MPFVAGASLSQPRRAHRRDDDQPDQRREARAQHCAAPGGKGLFCCLSQPPRTVPALTHCIRTLTPHCICAALTHCICGCSTLLSPPCTCTACMCGGGARGAGLPLPACRLLIRPAHLARQCHIHPRPGVAPAAAAAPACPPRPLAERPRALRARPLDDGPALCTHRESLRSSPTHTHTVPALACTARVCMVSPHSLTAPVHCAVVQVSFWMSFLSDVAFATQLTLAHRELFANET